MSICSDPGDSERDKVLSNLQPFSSFDDRTVQFVEVSLCWCKNLFIIFVFISKNYFY